MNVRLRMHYTVSPTSPQASQILHTLIKRGSNKPRSIFSTAKSIASPRRGEHRAYPQHGPRYPRFPVQLLGPPHEEQQPRNPPWKRASITRSPTVSQHWSTSSNARGNVCEMALTDGASPLYSAPRCRKRREKMPITKDERSGDTIATEGAQPI